MQKSQTLITMLLLMMLSFVITTISPRYGYAFDRNDEQAPLVYVSSDKTEKVRTDTYQSDDGTIMTFEYDSRFWGKRTFTYGNAKPEIAEVMIDGGLRNATGDDESYDASRIGFSVVRNDAGGFFFLTYLLPLALILLAKVIIDKWHGRFKKTTVTFSIVLIVAALFISARLDTFLALL